MVFLEQVGDDMLYAGVLSTTPGNVSFSRSILVERFVPSAPSLVLGVITADAVKRVVFYSPDGSGIVKSLQTFPNFELGVDVELGVSSVTSLCYDHAAGLLIADSWQDGNNVIYSIPTRTLSMLPSALKISNAPNDRFAGGFADW